MRRRSRTVPDEFADITHSADRDPEPGVADVGVPMDVVHRQALPWAPLVGLGKVVGGDRGRGLGGRRGQPQSGCGDAA